MAPESYLVNKLSIIDNLPLFSDLSFFQKRLIVSKSEIVEFKKGDIIYQEGDPPDYFYCMVTGRVDIYHPPKKAKRHQEKRIECVRKGDYFGSISLLTGKPHTISARALNDSAILRIRTKDFNHILRKIPKLAIFLSHSLSRRLSRKPFKEIFESKIIGIYRLDNHPDLSSYTRGLADSLKKESGKKILIIKSESILNKKSVSSKLSSFTQDYHYILVDIPSGQDDINFEILKQSDICHILSPSDKDSLHKVPLLIKRLEDPLKKHSKEGISVILKEDRFYVKTSHAAKLKILSKETFATLPADNIERKKTIRRIAREISGSRVGLVLSGGAAMGLAHIGVFKVLEREKIPIDIISASSMGAFIAALWAAGYTVNQLEKLAYSFKSKLKTLSLIDPVLPVRGLIKGRAAKKILETHLGNKTFSDLKLPLKIVACDIKNRSEVIIDKGRLVDAVMASIAIPGVFEPVEHNGAQLVDGGIVNPAPVSVLSKLGIKRIIAVNTLPSPEDIVRTRQKRLNIYDVIVNSFQAMESTMALSSCQQADVYLHPIPKLADWYEFYKAKLFINTGREHTKRMLPKIKSLCTTRIK